MGEASSGAFEQASSIHTPRVAESIRSGLESAATPPSDDKSRIALMLIDAQIDFVHEDGGLSVPGAMADARRTAEWIYTHASSITHIFASLDTHVPLQIFFPTWWEDSERRQPEPYTPIATGQVERGEWRPRFEKEWSATYVKKLAQQAKKDLMIWPYHVLLGTPGHALTPILYEAIAYHSSARSTQPSFEIKGLIDRTEYYSLLEPEVKVPEDPQGALNARLLEKLLSYDAIYFAGQAKSHCVLETIASIVKRYGEDRAVMEKLYLLEDCTSSVQHPTIDFDAIASKMFTEYASLGMKIATSDDPVN